MDLSPHRGHPTSFLYDFNGDSGKSFDRKFPITIKKQQWSGWHHAATLVDQDCLTRKTSTRLRQLMTIDWLLTYSLFTILAESVYTRNKNETTVTLVTYNIKLTRNLTPEKKLAPLVFTSSQNLQPLSLIVTIGIICNRQQRSCLNCMTHFFLLN